MTKTVRTKIAERQVPEASGVDTWGFISFYPVLGYMFGISVFKFIFC
jgi:hypothetical protein